MTPQPHDDSTARPAADVVNRRYNPGRYRLVDRDSDPNHHLFPNPDDGPIHRPRDTYCTKRGTP